MTTDIILDVQTPALLFPAISLLFLAYTNRFLATGQLIRSLASNIEEGKSTYVKIQISNLTKRMFYIKWAQILGAFSLLGCTLSMLFIFVGFQVTGDISFIVSLVLMLLSLGSTIVEICISTTALNFEIKGMNTEE